MPHYAALNNGAINSNLHDFIIATRENIFVVELYICSGRNGGNEITLIVVVDVFK